MEHRSSLVLNVEDGQLPLPQVMVSRRTVSSSKSLAWRVCGVVLALGLCAVAAVCFSLNKSQSNQEGGTGLRLTLRDLSEAKFTSKAAIHLTGAFNINVSTDKILWTKDQDHGFSSGGLDVVNEEILIPTDGVYFVYSQVSFYFSHKSELNENHEAKPMSHMVFRYSDSYGGEKPLFSAIRSTYVNVPESGNLWYNTIYLGAAFRLLAGDRLRTETTKELLPAVDSDNGKTFFGVFAL